jgi:hypothetical protein
MPIFCQEDIASKNWKERVANLPEDTQEKLALYRKKHTMTEELLPIKRKRPKLERGDVFVVQPREGLYSYGRVLNVDVSTRFRGTAGAGDGYKWHDALVVCIYNCKTTQLSLDAFLSHSDILTKPQMVIVSVFTSGYFFKLGNVPITPEEQVRLDYGFYDISSRTIVDEYGDDIEHMPQFLHSMGLGNFGAVSYSLMLEFIINPSLLQMGPDDDADAHINRIISPPAPVLEKGSFEEEIHPFSYQKYGKKASVCLEVGEYKHELFQARANEGFCGNGYDWESLAKVFLQKQKPELASVIDFDSEAGMFCALSKDSAALRLFATSFKKACEDDILIAKLFSEAVLE